MIDIPYLRKIDPIIDDSSSRLYDKGENIYISIDGWLETDNFHIKQGQVFTQMGLTNPQLYTIMKENFNHRILIYKVNVVWNQLEPQYKEDFINLFKITQNSLLQKYQSLPSILLPYIKREEIEAKQIIEYENAIVFLIEGIIEQNGHQILDYFEGQANTLTYCKIYVLKKSIIYPQEQDILQLPLFGDCDVQLQTNNLMLKSAVLQFDSPKYKPSTVIKDLSTIKRLIKGPDYHILKQKMNDVFGRRSHHHPFQIMNITESSSVKNRTNFAEQTQIRKPIIRPVHVSREPKIEQPLFYEFQKINYASIRNRSRVKIHSPPKQEPQQQIQKECLPIIKSFVSVEEYQQQQQMHIQRQNKQKQKQELLGKLLEFNKIINQLIK